MHAQKTKKNNCLIRQEYHNSSKPITVVTSFKKYVKKKPNKQQTNKTVKLYIRRLKKAMKIERNIKLSDTNKPSLKGDLHCDF